MCDGIKYFFQFYYLVKGNNKNQILQKVQKVIKENIEISVFIKKVINLRKKAYIV